jgi:hypothetical protein
MKRRISVQAGMRIKQDTISKIARVKMARSVAQAV